MNLARSSFYYNPRGKDPEQMKAEADLRDKIEAICLGSLQKITYARYDVIVINNGPGGTISTSCEALRKPRTLPHRKWF
jgi:hypothetical protein